jgi:hypothetical protein
MPGCLIESVRFHPMIRFLMSARQFHFLHQMATQLRAWLLLSLLLFGGWAQAAPSACTAMWGLRGQTLVYWNGTTWAASGSTTVAAGNAMGGYAADGSLFYTSGVASNGSTVVNMHSTTFSNISGTVNFSASLGAIGTPTGASALTYTTTSSVSQNFTPTQLNFVGATFDRSTTTRAMFLYATANMAPGTIPTNSTTAGTVLAIIGLLDPAVPTSVSWKMLYESQGAGTITYPRIFGSGDIFADQDTGQIWILTNTQPVNQLLRVSLNYTGLTLNSAQVTARVDIPALTGSSAGIAVNPLTGKVYVSTGRNSRTFELTSHLSDPIIATQVDAVGGVVDSGNCVERPDPPTITKSFNPDKSTATVGTVATGTFTLTITNPNKTPIFLSQSITDTLPAPLGLPRTDALKFLTAACFSDGAAATRPSSNDIDDTGVVDHDAGDTCRRHDSGWFNDRGELYVLGPIHHHRLQLLSQHHPGREFDHHSGHQCRCCHGNLCQAGDQFQFGEVAAVWQRHHLADHRFNHGSSCPHVHLRADDRQQHGRRDLDGHVHGHTARFDDAIVAPHAYRFRGGAPVRGQRLQSQAPRTDLGSQELSSQRHQGRHVRSSSRGLVPVAWSFRPRT